jgi:hypothetical protein
MTSFVFLSPAHTYSIAQQQKLLNLGETLFTVWIASVEEALLTQEQRAEIERIQKNSLCRFLCPRLTKVYGSIKARKTHFIYSSKSIQRIIKGMSNRTLQECGFRTRCRSLDEANSIDPKCQADSIVKKSDFSNTYVSTSP